MSEDPARSRETRPRLRRGIAGLAISLALASGVGCQQEPRVPYIPAKLHSWPHPYRGTPGLEVCVLDTGTLRVPAALLFRGGSFVSRRAVDVLVFLVHHPRKGWIAVGTGLSPEIAVRAQTYTGFMLSLVFDPAVAPQETLSDRLGACGVEPKQVRHLILPDLHFDHTGGLDVFPGARVVVSRREYEAARGGGFGYIPGEYDHIDDPDLIEFPADAPLGTFYTHVDLFGDGSVYLLATPGPSAGSLGVLLMATPRPIFLAGDLVPSGETLAYAVRPGLLHSARDWMDSFWRLKKLLQLVPGLLVLPGHDIAAARAAADVVIVPEGPAPTPSPSPTPAARGWKPYPLQ